MNMCMCCFSFGTISKTFTFTFYIKMRFNRTVRHIYLFTLSCGCYGTFTNMHNHTQLKINNVSAPTENRTRDRRRAVLGSISTYCKATAVGTCENTRMTWEDGDWPASSRMSRDKMAPSELAARQRYTAACTSLRYCAAENAPNHRVPLGRAPLVDKTKQIVNYTCGTISSGLLVDRYTYYT